MIACDGFTMIVLRLNQEDEGEGMLEHYDLQPALLQNVEREHGER